MPGIADRRALNWFSVIVKVRKADGEGQHLHALVHEHHEALVDERKSAPTERHSDRVEAPRGKDSRIQRRLKCSPGGLDLLLHFVAHFADERIKRETLELFP